MKTFWGLSAGGVLATTVALTSSASVSLPNGWFSIAPQEKIKQGKFNGEARYLTWMADSQIKHGVEPTFAYTVSAFYSGVLLAYNRTRDEKYLTYVKHYADVLLYPAWNGDILLYNNSNSIDDIRFGHTFLDLYHLTGGNSSSDIYKTAAQTLRTQIDRTRRTPDGGFYHRYPVYTDQMWLDGIYMLDVFYARWTRAFDPANTTAWDDIALQFDLIHAGTTNTSSSERTSGGLPVHGFDWSKKAVWAHPDTGAAPHVWGRAVGWYVMALVDTLELFPAAAGAAAEHPGRGRLLAYLRSVCDAVVDAQDADTRGWWLVMTPGTEGRWGNYIESSASSMFVYALLKSVRLGYVGEEGARAARYVEAAMAGYRLMTGTFASVRESDGALTYSWTVQTGSLSSNGTFEYYASMPLFENDLKGVAPFLFASYEYELYLEQTM